MAKKPKLGSGASFKKVAGSVAKGYMKKGMSAKKAKAIGGAVAAKIGRKKYGAKKMAKMSAAGRRRRST